MSTKTCEFPTGTVWSGPKVCGRPAKYVVKESNEFNQIKAGQGLCGIHKRSALKYREATLEPLAKEHP